KISIPFFKISFWGSMEVQPYTTEVLNYEYLPYDLNFYSICMARSCVGLIINDFIFFPLFGASCLSNNNCNMGKAKAAVFPVPVCAETITSFFANTNGMVFC